MAPIDLQLFLLINGMAGKTPILDDLALALVNDYTVPVSFSLFLLGLWFGVKRADLRNLYQRIALSAAMAVGLASGIVDLTNVFYFRPRPFADQTVNLLFYPPTDSSFPSHPTAVAFAVAWTVFLGNRLLGGILLVVALLYGFSRLYVGVAYPLDILGGASVGIIGAYAAVGISRIAESAITLVLRLARRLYLA